MYKGGTRKNYNGYRPIYALNKSELYSAATPTCMNKKNLEMMNLASTPTQSGFLN